MSGRMIALLGLLAVAGYQNRDKLGQLLGRATGSDTAAGTAPGTVPPVGAAQTQPAGGGFFDNLGNIFGGANRTGSPDAGSGGIGGFFDNLFGGNDRDGVGGGLRDLVDRFRGNGHEEEAKSWIETGANREISEPALAEALGEDTIAELTAKTGLSRHQLLDRLRTVLPTAVDTLTPEGRLPPASPYTGSQV